MHTDMSVFMIHGQCSWYMVSVHGLHGHCSCSTWSVVMVMMT